MKIYQIHYYNIDNAKGIHTEEFDILNEDKEKIYYKFHENNKGVPFYKKDLDKLLRHGQYGYWMFTLKPNESYFIDKLIETKKEEFNSYEKEYLDLKEELEKLEKIRNGTLK